MTSRGVPAKCVYGSHHRMVSLATVDVDCGNYSFLRLAGNENHYLCSSLPGASKQFMLSLSSSPAGTVLDLLSLQLTSHL